MRRKLTNTYLEEENTPVVDNHPAAPSLFHLTSIVTRNLDNSLQNVLNSFPG